MRDKGYNIDPVPSIELVGDDVDNAGMRNSWVKPRTMIRSISLSPYTLTGVIPKILCVLTRMR
jgi:hypothetical protein